jgi:hypothetical protein
LVESVASMTPTKANGDYIAYRTISHGSFQLVSLMHMCCSF